MFAPPPMTNPHGYGHQHAYPTQAHVEQWMQAQQPYIYSAEPEDDPSLMASVPVPFMPPQIVPTQHYTQHSAQPTYFPASPASNASASASASPKPPTAHQQKTPAASKSAAAARAAGAAKKQPVHILPSPPASRNGDALRQQRGVKRTKHDSDNDSDSPESSSEDGDRPAEGTAQAPATATSRRPPGACTYCRRVKMKCEFPPGSETCKRCRQGNHKCVVEGRKPRRAPSKREYLLAQLRQKDGIIESLLKQLHNPYSSDQKLSNATVHSTSPDQRENVVAWLDQLQTSVRNPPKRSEPAPSARLSSLGGDSDEESASGQHGGLALVSDEDAHPTLPDVASPWGFLANLALGSIRQGEPAHRQKRLRADGTVDASDAPDGVASYEFFVPGPSLDLDRRISMTKEFAPDLIVHGVIHPNEIENLFNIFHNRVNPFMGVLDARIHTPRETFARCPLLFSTICAISLRYSERPHDTFQLAMHFAKRGAADALVDGWKSVELAQAYVFLSLYAVPTRKLEEDRSMLYAGLAVRIASDLNVRAAAERTPRNEIEAREIANHRRLWMACFTLDKQTAAAFGKASTIHEGPVVSTAEPDGFPTELSDSNPFDIHLAAKVMLMRDLTRFHSEIFSDASVPGAFNNDLDLREIVLRYDTEFTRTSDLWSAKFQRESDKTNQMAVFRCKLLPFYVGASRLVILAFMLQQAFKRGLQSNDETFFKRSLDVARTVVNVMLDLIAPTGYLRYAPDCYFVYSAFASAFLLKLLRQECRPFIRETREREIFAAVERLVDLFNSPKVAIDDRHTPRLYAEFLAKLLAKSRRERETRANGRGASPSAMSSVSTLSSGSGRSHTYAGVSPSMPQGLSLQSLSPNIPQGLSPHIQQGLSPHVPQVSPQGLSPAHLSPPIPQGMPPQQIHSPHIPQVPQGLFGPGPGSFGPTPPLPAPTFPGWEQAHQFAAGGEAISAGYPTPESLTETLGEGMEMGVGQSFAFTFTAPPPEELKAAEEERSSAWWGAFVTPGLNWISDDVALNAGGNLPSPYEQPSCFVPPAAY